jgi:hypothetical protein
MTKCPACVPDLCLRPELWKPRKLIRHFLTFFTELTSIIRFPSVEEGGRGFYGR